MAALGYAGISLERGDKTSLPEAMLVAEGTDDKDLKRFVARLRSDYLILSDLIEDLDVFQLGQLVRLLDIYNMDLESLNECDPTERQEFFLSLTFNLIRDIKNYTSDRLIRKRMDEVNLSPVKKEVACLATSFSLYMN